MPQPQNSPITHSLLPPASFLPSSVPSFCRPSLPLPSFHASLLASLAEASLGRERTSSEHSRAERLRWLGIELSLRSPGPPTCDLMHGAVPLPPSHTSLRGHTSPGWICSSIPS